MVMFFAQRGKCRSSVTAPGPTVPSPGGRVIDPHGRATSSFRVMRGGDWYDCSWYCRSASRGYDDPRLTLSVVGFRVVLDTGK